MRNTKQKEIIMKALGEHRVHPTADELYQYIHNEHAEIGVATVYRNLNLLSEKGLIKKISGLGDASHFDFNTEPHFHFICNCCGRVHDITEAIAPDLIKKAEGVSGCKILSLDINFRGLCLECQEHGTYKQTSIVSDLFQNSA